MVTKRQTAAVEESASTADTDTDTTADDGPVDESKVREIVHEALAALGIGGGDDDGAGGAEPDGDGKPAARTQAAVEADVEGKVRAEIEKLRGEEDRDRRLAALETKIAEPERPPVKERVSTRLMGWSRSR